MKTIIIFGANGMLGTYCCKYLSSFFNVIKITRNDLNVEACDVDVLTNLIESRKEENTLVLNCIGLIKQRNAKSSSYIRVNSVFPHLLNEACIKTKVNYIHVSTDCVFDGSKGNYTEVDLHTATDIYGASKSAGEGNFQIIRTSIIGEEDRNKLSLIEWVKSQNGKTIDGYVNHLWNGVTCLQFAKVIKHIIDNNISWCGVKHLFSPDIVSKKDLVEYIVKVYDLDIKIIPTFTSVNIDRSLSTVTSNTFVVPSIYDQVKELVELNSREVKDSCNNIFIVTSVINTISKTINNGNVRSIYTPEQRLEQTVNTLKSIYSKVPNPYCILVESSSLTEEQKDVLTSNCNILIDCSRSDICKHFVNGDNKSLGETITVFHAMKYILEKEIKFNTLSKLSGRYYLDDTYEFDFDNKYITCKMFSNQYETWYSSALYCVGWKQRWLYFDMLFNSLFCMEKTHLPDIERNMYRLLPKSVVKLKERIGMSGNLSSSGEYVQH